MRFTLILLLLLACPTPANAGSIWHSSPPLAPALRKAAPKNNLLVLKVSTSWCGACRDQEVELVRPEMVRFLGSYHRLAYDAEQGEGLDVARRFNVISFPTLLVINSQAKELGRITGHKPAAELLTMLKAITSGDETLERREEGFAGKLKEGKESTKMLGERRLALGKAWALRGDRARAMNHLGPLIAAPGELSPKALMIKGKYLELLSLEAYADALKTFKALRKAYPKSPEAARAGIPTSRALHGLGKTRSALKLIKRWARGERIRERAAAWFCLHHVGNARAAMGHARRAVALDSKDANAWALLAMALEKMGRTSSALEAMNKAIALDPDNAALRRTRELYRRTLIRETVLKR